MRVTDQTEARAEVARVQDYVSRAAASSQNVLDTEYANTRLAKANCLEQYAGAAHLFAKLVAETPQNLQARAGLTRGARNAKVGRAHKCARTAAHTAAHTQIRDTTHKRMLRLSHSRENSQPRSSISRSENQGRACPSLARAQRSAAPRTIRRRSLLVSGSGARLSIVCLPSWGQGLGAFMVSLEFI